MTTAPDIVVDARDNGLTWITINRPQKHNALARPVLDALAAAVRAAGSNTGTRAIVISGAGDKYFAAGGDLVDLASVRSDAEIDAMGDQASAALDAVRRCAAPVVAYVNGDVVPFKTLKQPKDQQDPSDIGVFSADKIWVRGSPHSPWYQLARSFPDGGRPFGWANNPRP